MFLAITANCRFQPPRRIFRVGICTQLSRRSTRTDHQPHHVQRVRCPPTSRVVVDFFTRHRDVIDRTACIDHALVLLDFFPSCVQFPFEFRDVFGESRQLLVLFVLQLLVLRSFLRIRRARAASLHTVCRRCSTDHFEGLFESSGNVTFASIAIMPTATARRSRDERIVLNGIHDDFLELFHGLKTRERVCHCRTRSLDKPLLSWPVRLRLFYAGRALAVRSRAFLDETNEKCERNRRRHRNNERSIMCLNLLDMASRSLMACSRSYWHLSYRSRN